MLNYSFIIPLFESIIHSQIPSLRGESISRPGWTVDSSLKCLYLLNIVNFHSELKWIELELIGQQYSISIRTQYHRGCLIESVDRSRRHAQLIRRRTPIPKCLSSHDWALWGLSLENGSLLSGQVNAIHRLRQMNQRFVSVTTLLKLRAPLHVLFDCVVSGVDLLSNICADLAHRLLDTWDNFKLLTIIILK